VLRRSIEPSQYTSAEFHRFCKENLIRTSLGRTGVCWDNAAAESFFAALKNEMSTHDALPTHEAREDARRYVRRKYRRALRRQLWAPLEK